jgi:hypothetical protein
MKDSEFISLLNLYLDHEISADDAARLEAEVQGNPARRRLYRDYCRMQKACKVLAQDFESDEVADSDHKVIAFPAPASGRRVGWYVTGTLAAAAACVALVFVSHRDATRTGAAPAVQVSAPVAQTVASTATPLAAPHRGIERGNASDLSLRHTDPNLALATATQNDPHFAWMQNVQLSPLDTATLSQLNLKAAPSPKLDNRTNVAGNQTLPPDIQWTAVRFQR